MNEYSLAKVQYNEITKIQRHEEIRKIWSHNLVTKSIVNIICGFVLILIYKYVRAREIEKMHEIKRQHTDF